VITVHRPKLEKNQRYVKNTKVAPVAVEMAVGLAHLFGLPVSVATRLPGNVPLIVIVPL